MDGFAPESSELPEESRAVRPPICVFSIWLVAVSFAVLLVPPVIVQLKLAAPNEIDRSLHRPAAQPEVRSSLPLTERSQASDIALLTTQVAAIAESTSVAPILQSSVPSDLFADAVRISTTTTFAIVIQPTFTVEPTQPATSATVVQPTSPAEPTQPAILTASPTVAPIDTLNEDTRQIAADSVDALRAWVAAKLADPNACKRTMLVEFPKPYCSPKDGVGNCLLGVIGGIAIAVMADAVPVVYGGKPTCLQGLKFSDLLQKCAGQKFDKAKVIGPMRFGGIDIAKMLALEDISNPGRVVSPSKVLSKGQYVGAWLTLNQVMSKRICALYPGSCSNDSRYFGFFHATYHAFVSQSSDNRVDHVLDKSTWMVQGPLIVMHFRKIIGPGSMRCLRKIIKDSDLKGARIYVAATWTPVRDAFQAEFGIDQTGIPSDRDLAARGKFQFRFTDAFQEKGAVTSAAFRARDRKSASAMVDWRIMTSADILAGEDFHTTFLSTAAGMGVPRLMYLYDPEACILERFREPCLHSYIKMFQKEPFKDLSWVKTKHVKEYWEFCYRRWR
eukprot:TRINITY_DN73450_c0_g1_i1.p1 TRINITY_DN73450_c0_g1~~TRINITY_DN73450_c0_g1_i1.p1  ORF type:complete len:559 (+),score=59.28 TRINITY_DN73450_c0_g1_i1:35-1711(+)